MMLLEPISRIIDRGYVFKFLTPGGESASIGRSSRCLKHMEHARTLWRIALRYTRQSRVFARRPGFVATTSRARDMRLGKH